MLSYLCYLIDILFTRYMIVRKQVEHLSCHKSSILASVAHHHMPSASSMQIEILSLGGQLLTRFTAEPSSCILTTSLGNMLNYDVVFSNITTVARQ